MKRINKMNPEDFLILIVDDNPDNINVVGNILRDQGFKIAVATSGVTTFQILKRIKPNLILLDVMMPDINGYEVCEKLKSDDKTSEIPVIFLTAKVQTEDVVEGFKKGGVDYVTKPFKREELLMRINTHLELAYSKKRILEINKNREKLFSIIAHDIKSPFSGIMQTIGAIADGYFKATDDDFLEIMNDLKERTVHTSALLENLLEWTRFQSETIVLDPQYTLIANLLAECKLILSGAAKSKNINIEVDIPEDIMAYCDEISMHTVFRNLISNSIKFTNRNGCIKINAAKTDNYIDVIFEDNGIGMKKEIIDKIFKQEKRHTSVGTNDEKGTGLGLFMIKDFVQKNNGTVEISSIPAKGTIITVRIPAEKHVV